ncbi:MAG: copper amine oxidase N-terminal domain-containing protein [Firmicutes bacterium]|nr:copper amine oxidase N-terminal domain-containing protein [Bacillota bacterium]MBQ9605186.1 copper amine oxidase N-terminal domain-containing protein [Bacillota bacterium]
MKRFFALLCAAVCAMSASVFAGDVSVNGNIIDAQTVIVDSRTLVPVRGVFEELGYTVEWDGETKTASLTGEKTVIIKSGETTFTVDGATVTPEVPQQIIEGRFMLPLRAVGEAIGAEVDWEAETKTVIITTQRKGGLKVVDVQEL